jgi:chemotaxis signal transduction protein
LRQDADQIGVRGDLLVAIVPQGEDVYLLIDIDSVLTSDERTALASVELPSA